MGIATGMVVREYQADTAQARCIGHDLAYWHGYGVGIALIAFDMKAACAFIDMGYPEPLRAVIPGVEAS